MLVQWMGGHIYANQQSPLGELAESCHFCENGTLPAGSLLNQICPHAYRIHCICALRRFWSRLPIHCSDIVYSTHGRFLDDDLHYWSKPNKDVRVGYKLIPWLVQMLHGCWKSNPAMTKKLPREADVTKFLCWLVFYKPFGGKKGISSFT